MIDKQEVASLAALARLEFTTDELEAFAAEFGRIVDYVGAIANVDVRGIEPMTHVHNNVNVLREDVAGECLQTVEALANAPHKNDAFFKVPKVLG